jgi:hypothetical protein
MLDFLKSAVGTGSALTSADNLSSLEIIISGFGGDISEVAVYVAALKAFLETWSASRRPVVTFGTLRSAGCLMLNVYSLATPATITLQAHGLMGSSIRSRVRKLLAITEYINDLSLNPMFYQCPEFAFLKEDDWHEIVWADSEVVRVLADASRLCGMRTSDAVTTLDLASEQSRLALASEVIDNAKSLTYVP